MFTLYSQTHWHEEKDKIPTQTHKVRHENTQRYRYGERET